MFFDSRLPKIYQLESMSFNDLNQDPLTPTGNCRFLRGDPENTLSALFLSRLSLHT
jgi:hypothetical protein